MEEKKNMKRSLNNLEVGGQEIFVRDKYKVSSLRSVAAMITADTGKRFNVALQDEIVIVTRKI